MRNADQGEASPPRATLGEAAARYWWVVVGSAVVLLGAGVAVAGSVSPTYTAVSQLTVGTVDAQTQAIPGYVQAATSLAATYSRMATTSSVIRPASREIGISSRALRARISATPVINGPTLNLKATGDSDAEAVRTSITVARSLVTAVQKVSSRVEDPNGPLLTEYRRSSIRAIRAEGRLVTLQTRRRRDASSVSRAELQRAQSTAETARLKAVAAGQVYSQARQRTTSAAGLSLLDQPVASTSDRSSTVQKLGFVGLTTGLVIGLALAAMLDRGRRRRRRRRGRVT